MALNLLSNTDYPSIGYYFANGEEAATENLWELPDANREGVGMNSRNHHMWSSYSSYLVRKVAGISQHRASSGHWDLELRPGYFKDLSYASSTLKLKQGDVVLNWEKIGGTHCDRAAKGDVVHLNCGENGGVLAAIEFDALRELEQNSPEIALRFINCIATGELENLLSRISRMEGKYIYIYIS